MKKLVAIALFTGTLAFGQSKKVTNSNVQWWGYKLAKTEASSHNGVVNVKAGDVVLKNNQIVGGTFVLDMTTINSLDLSGEYQTKLNNHLKSEDFFETNKFPTATYKITGVKKNANKAFPFMVYGNLTAKGKTSPVSFPAKIALNKGVLTMTSDKFAFDRQKFDIAYRSAAKDVIVKDEIDMIIDITAK